MRFQSSGVVALEEIGLAALSHDLFYRDGRPFAVSSQPPPAPGSCWVYELDPALLETLPEDEIEDAIFWHYHGAVCTTAAQLLEGEVVPFPGAAVRMQIDRLPPIR